jgi:hypothetical protein
MEDRIATVDDFRALGKEVAIQCAYDFNERCIGPAAVTTPAEWRRAHHQVLEETKIANLVALGCSPEEIAAYREGLDAELDAMLLLYAEYELIEA